ncbi:MAG: MFS transporter [Candidatus Omnitrophota bacterium]
MQDDTIGKEKRSALGNIFRALRYRNFRLFFFGQGVSLVGTWIQYTAMSWLVYRLTHSAFMLGVVGFATQIPSFLFSAFAGVMVDRWNRHRVLVVTQALSMLQAFILALLTLRGHITVWQIIALGVFIGCVNAVDVPNRQSFIIDMVERKDNLGNAIALNSFTFNVAKLIGPSAAGILIVLVGEGFCFLINAISYLFVIASLLFMRIEKRKKARNAHLWAGLKEGFAYAFGSAAIRLLLMLLAVMSLMGMSSMVLMPVFVRDILRGGPGTLGFLFACGGVGALVATVYLASRKDALTMGNIIPGSALVFALGIIGFALSRSVYLSAVLLFICGFGSMVNMAASNTILQTIVEDDKRGRVMSIYTMAFIGLAPVGSLMAGFLASEITAPNAVIIGGLSCIAAAVFFFRKVPVLKKSAHLLYQNIDVVSKGGLIEA